VGVIDKEIEDEEVEEEEEEDYYEDKVLLLLKMVAIGTHDTFDAGNT